MFACLIAVALADDEIPILRSESEVNPDGSYEYNYETGNGISAQESGKGGESVQGSYSFTDDSGKVHDLKYIADENGFQPSSDDLPVPPPIPKTIERALKYLAEHPPPEE